MKILHKTWFTEMGATRPIGIVIVDTGLEIKSYIGTAFGDDEERDTQHIAERGAKINLTAAAAACGVDIDSLTK